MGVRASQKRFNLRFRFSFRFSFSFQHAPVSPVSGDLRERVVSVCWRYAALNEFGCVCVCVSLTCVLDSCKD